MMLNNKSLRPQSLGLALQEFCVVPVGETPHKSILVGDFKKDSEHQLLNLVSNGVTVAHNSDSLGIHMSKWFVGPS